METMQRQSRKELVAAAVERWAKDLVDTGKRNPLLYYRPLQAGTLSFDHADPAALTAFLAGSQIKLSALFPTPTVSADALKRIRTIRKKILTLEEERGIQTGYLVLPVTARCKNENRKCLAELANFLDQGDPVELGQPQINDGCVIGEFIREIKTGATVGGIVYHVAMPAQPLHQLLPQQVFILYYQQPHPTSPCCVPEFRETVANGRYSRVTAPLRESTNTVNILPSLSMRIR